MPRYYFDISRGTYAGVSDAAFECKDDTAAWTEMTKVCGDLVGDVMRDLKPKSDWKMELLNESKTAIFRISLLAETLI
jgi:hypothetical protein